MEIFAEMLTRNPGLLSSAFEMFDAVFLSILGICFC